MLRWRFATYVTGNGRSNVQGDIDDFDDFGIEDFAAAVRHLAPTAKEHWDEPHALKLKGRKDLYEIRFKNARKQTRALGHFAGDTFIITVICTHKSRVYDPPESFQTAEDRRVALGKGQASATSLKIHGVDFPPVP